MAIESRKRSRDGCWTCKSHRQKCDGVRPICLNCQSSKRRCAGFEVRLQWENGIASRGRFTGASKPIEDAILDRPKGRKRDLTRKPSRTKPSIDSDQSISTADSVNGIDQSREEDIIVPASASVNGDTPETSGVVATQEESLLAEFFQSGIHALHATLENDFENSDLPLRLSQLCQQSQALQKVCIALQAAMSDYHRSQVLEYFDTALRIFREELNQTGDHLHDGTMTFGILLCTLCMMNGLPWTVHLHGMHQILQSFGLQASSVSQFSPFQCHSIEVMGIMDLPTIVLGRQTPCLGIWKRYCRNPNFHHKSDRDSVEHVSGLPRSLVDILSDIGEGGATELDFWDWPGAKGSFIQIQLWEAYRLAAILSIRHRNLQSALGLGQAPCRTRPDLRSRRPEDYILVPRLLSHLDAILRAFETLEQHGNRLMNAIQYPACVAALEVLCMNENPPWKTLVRDCFAQQARQMPAWHDNELLLEFLEELWSVGVDRSDIDKTLRERGLEISLI